ncbi:MAG: DUF1987 domain-containing protein [Bacteroidia bacterium]
MEALHIQASKTNPEVDFDPAKPAFTIKGRSIPADAMMFYSPLDKWTDRYVSGFSGDKITIEIVLDHLNTGSVRTLITILSKYIRLREKGVKVVINWFHDVEDEDMMDKGEEMSLILDHPFHYIAFRSEN